MTLSSQFVVEAIALFQCCKVLANNTIASGAKQTSSKRYFGKNSDEQVNIIDRSIDLSDSISILQQDLDFHVLHIDELV